MNCNTCKHYDKSNYPFHCELANKNERFSNDCVHGIFHYEPKDDCADAEIEEKTSYAKVHDKYVTIKEYNESVINQLRKDIDWKATIGCWFLLLFIFALLTANTYLCVTIIINKTFNISTAFLLVSTVCLFYITLKYFWQIAMPKHKY